MWATIMSFKFSKLRLVNTSKDENGNLQYLKRWYVTYTITYPNDLYPDYPVREGKEQPTLKNKKYPKIFGLQYDTKLNEITDNSQKLLEGKALLKMVELDLMQGNDPRLKNVVEDEKAEIAHEEANGVSYDEALAITRKYMQWDLNLPAKQITERQNMSFFNNSFRRFIHHIGKTNDITKVTTDDLKKFVELSTSNDGTVVELKGKKEKTFGHMSVKTAFEKIRVVAFIFNALLDCGKIEINPTLGVTDSRKKIKKTAKPRPIKDSNRYAIWTPEEFAKFKKIGNTDKWRTEYTVGLITYYTFIRASEILRIQVGMIDYKINKFVIPSNLTKSHGSYDSVKPLYISIPPVLLTALKDYIKFTFGKDIKAEYPLFPNPLTDVKQVYPYEIYKNNYKNFKEALGVVKQEYALKHTGVTDYYYMQLERGVPSGMVVEKLRKMCRHAKSDETINYLTLNLGLQIDDNTDDGWGVD